MNVLIIKNVFIQVDSKLFVQMAWGGKVNIDDSESHKRAASKMLSGNPERH